MPEEKYTRCPGCATVFRVTQEQLAMRAGQVRCGQCKSVFDGVAQQVSLAPTIRSDAGATPVDEAAQGPLTVTLRDAQALESPPAAPDEASAPARRSAEGAPMSATGRPERELLPPGGTVRSAKGAPISAETASEDRFAPVASTKPRRARPVFYAVAIAFLVLLVAAQATFHFRDAIAAFWPVARPAFARLCAVAGCAIRPLRDAAMSHLSIEASDLQADPAHRGLLILTATVRNRAGWPLAYPHLELTLTDAQDRVVVRRALAPADYAGGTADLQKGIAPNGEIALKVFIDASATSQAGYRLYMFYP
jgi:predicted Zn finger-like uncharacterized protein